MGTRCELETLQSSIESFLKEHNLQDTNPSWVIKKSPVGGFGVFTTKDISPNEIIYKDAAVIIGPRATPTSELVCVICYSKAVLNACSKGCGLPLCSEACENSKYHLKECNLIRSFTKRLCEQVDVKRAKSLTPLRALLLDDCLQRLVKNLKSHKGSQHGFEIDALKSDGFEFSKSQEVFLKFVCSVLDANAFEVVAGNESNHTTLRGLYPLASLSNHQCVPNAMHVFDHKQRMVVKAAVFIPAGSEIFHSYCRVIWGTMARRYHLLRTKHFECQCPRCGDPTEFGTNMSGVNCPKCNSIILPINPLKLTTNWKCENCPNVLNFKKANTITAIIGSRLANFTDEDFDDMSNFLKTKLLSIVQPTNQLAIEIKYRQIWILGYKSGFLWPELSNENVALKEELCREILDLLKKLGAGQCKMRGLLLYELYCTLKEKQKRGGSYDEKEFNDIFTEAADILQEDICCPKELQEKRNEINNNDVQ